MWYACTSLRYWIGNKMKKPNIEIVVLLINWSKLNWPNCGSRLPKLLQLVIFVWSTTKTTWKGATSDEGVEGSSSAFVGRQLCSFSVVLEGKDGRWESLLSCLLTPPLPLPALEPQLQFLEYQAWCYAQWLCFKVFPGYYPVVFWIISHHLQSSFSFSRAPSITVELPCNSPPH